MFIDHFAAERLAMEVIRRAVLDLHSNIPKIQEDAKRFLQTDTFWLEAAGLDPKAVRRVLPQLFQNANKVRCKKEAHQVKTAETLRWKHQLATSGC